MVSLSLDGQTSKKMKVAIKYCGGCDPIYDRVEFVHRIKEEAGDSIEWVSLEKEGYDAILLVCGCLKACPESELKHFSPLSLKYNGLSPERVVAQLLKKGQTNANQY